MYIYINLRCLNTVINTFITGHFSGPDKHILALFSKWEASISEKERLVSQISTLEQQYKTDLERQVSMTKQDSDNRVTDAVEKARLEGKNCWLCIIICTQKKYNRIYAKLDELKASSMYWLW